MTLRAALALMLLALPATARDVPGPWPLNSDATCPERREIIDRMAASTEVTLANTQTAVGEGVRITWSRGPFPEREPVFLMVSFDAPVRLGGEGVYGLMPGARAAFDIPWQGEATRAVVPYYGRGVPREGSFEVTPAAPGAMEVRWSVLGHDGCGAHLGADARLGTIAARAAVRPQVEGGAPEIVVGTPFTAEMPLETHVSADGARHLAVHDGRWQLLDAATGAEITERVGERPRFSPTGRWVFDLTGGYYDAVDGARVSDRAGGVHEVGWANADSVLVAEGGGYGSVGVTDAASGRTLASAGFGSRAGGDPVARIDLENSTVLIASSNGAGAHAIHTGLSDEFSTIWD